LQDAEADENPDIRAQAGPETRRGEQRQAEEKPSLSTKAVGQAPGRDQERGVDDRVPVQHQLRFDNDLSPTPLPMAGNPTFVIQTHRAVR
jgi:hypothetical protein